jgi:Flp pilus assembly protein TadB
MNSQSVHHVIPLILLLLFLLGVTGLVGWFIWIADQQSQKSTQMLNKLNRRWNDQATRDSEAQVDLHIQRQRALGEKMVGEHDQPRLADMVVTVLLVVMVFSGYGLGYL